MKPETLPSSRPLDYQPDTPRRRARRWIVRFTLLLLIGAGVIVIRWNWSAISHRAQEIYWFNRCMNHVTPPGTVSLEFDPTKAKALIGSNPEYFDVNSYAMHSPSGMDIPGISLYQSTVAQYVPREVREFERFARTATPFTDLAVVFAGERRTPSGKRRLVLIRGADVKYLDFRHLVGVSVFESPTVMRPTKQLYAGSFEGNYSGPLTTYYLERMIGTADPTNPSRIVVRFSAPTPRDDFPKSGTVHFDLLENDTVNMTVIPDTQHTSNSAGSDAH